MKRAIRAILQEPLIHFMLLGALIFLAFDILNDDDAGVQNNIIIGVETARQMSANFEKTWRRQPTADELTELIDNRIREEVLVREAEELGLDENDAVIRRRLSQKMEFLVESAVTMLQPSNEELVNLLKAKKQDYVRPGRISFEQVFLGADADAATVETAKAALDAGTDPVEVGQDSLLLPKMPLATGTAIDGAFGSGFYQALTELPLASWDGPVKSGFGMHLVRVIEREPGRIPELEEVRESLEHDWRKKKTIELTEQEYRRILSLYSVQRPDPTKIADFIR